MEHMTPVVLLTDAFVANGSAAWKLPKLADYPAIVPPYVRPEMQGSWTVSYTHLDVYKRQL